MTTKIRTLRAKGNVIAESVGLNGSAVPVRSVSMDKPKKRRKRSTSIEAQLKREAAKIYESGMAQAYNAAVGQMLIRKLDEVLALAAVTGYSTGTTGAPPIGLVQRTAPPPPQVTHPCTSCGRESVYRTKPHKFNPTGSWYCRDHAGIGVKSDVEDRADKVPINETPVTQAPPVISQGPPIEFAPSHINVSKLTVPAPTTPTPSDGLIAAMGMAEVVDE